MDGIGETIGFSKIINTKKPPSFKSERLSFIITSFLVKLIV